MKVTNILIALLAFPIAAFAEPTVMENLDLAALSVQGCSFAVTTIPQGVELRSFKVNIQCQEDSGNQDTAQVETELKDAANTINRLTNSQMTLTQKNYAQALVLAIESKINSFTKSSFSRKQARESINREQEMRKRADSTLSSLKSEFSCSFINGIYQCSAWHYTSDMKTLNLRVPGVLKRIDDAIASLSEYQSVVEDLKKLKSAISSYYEYTKNK